MIVKRLTTGMFSSNCYVVGDNGEGVIIDAGADVKEILDLVEESGLEIKYIILTHSHIDHIRSIEGLKQKTGAIVLIHSEEDNALTDPWKNASALFGINEKFNPAGRTLKDGEIITAGIDFEIIHTPGHSSGGICIKAQNLLFTGDTLFKMSIGRTDLGDGNHNTLLASIRTKLLTLDDDTVIYPGHGGSSTIGYEKKHNPFL